VTEREFLARMDAHLAVANQHMTAMREEQAAARVDRRRTDRLIERVEEEVRLTREEVRLSREERERARESQVRFQQHLDQRHVVLVQRVESGTALLNDLHDEHVAFRESLMRVHDRLEDLPRPYNDEGSSPPV
jgi:chromosome segregation ATPase